MAHLPLPRRIIDAAADALLAAAEWLGPIR